MADSIKPNPGTRSPEDQIDRYSRGELTAAESRDLAQSALDDPELFENLTYSAVAKAALSDPSMAERLEPDASVVRFPRRARLIAGFAAAAAILLISVYAVRSFRPQKDKARSAAATSVTPIAAAPLKPVLATSEITGQPILLADGLIGDASRPGIFRGAEPDSRSPHLTGAIVSIEDGQATVNLGSLDGLVQGSELQVFRDDRPTETVGHLQVTTVFREHARARIPDGSRIREKDQARVNGADHLNAVIEQIDAVYNRGNRDAAFQMAEQARDWAESASIPPDKQAALGIKLAVLQALRGDYAGAEPRMSRAVASLPKTDAAYAQGLNNLGVLAELRGDRHGAELLYGNAAHAFAAIADSPERERTAVEANLARLRGSH